MAESVTKNWISPNILDLFSKFKLIKKVNNVFNGIIKITTEENKIKHKILTFKMLIVQILAIYPV